LQSKYGNPSLYILRRDLRPDGGHDTEVYVHQKGRLGGEAVREEANEKPNTYFKAVHAA